MKVIHREIIDGREYRQYYHTEGTSPLYTSKRQFFNEYNYFMLNRIVELLPTLVPVSCGNDVDVHNAGTANAMCIATNTLLFKRCKKNVEISFLKRATSNYKL